MATTAGNGITLDKRSAAAVTSATWHAGAVVVSSKSEAVTEPQPCSPTLRIPSLCHKFGLFTSRSLAKFIDKDFLQYCLM